MPAPGPSRPSDSFSVLGRQLDSRPRTSALRGWLERHWRRDEHGSRRHRYRIVLNEATSAPGSAAPAGDGDPVPIEVRLPSHLTLRWTTHDGEWRTDGEAAGVRAFFDPGESRIDVWGTTCRRAHVEARAAAAPEAPWPALYVAFCEALRASGLIPLHAAVVVRDGAVVALTAPTGTGKTTTLIRLLGRGWRPLAEDLSWLDPASRTLYAWDRGLRLWPDALARLGPQFAAEPWTADRDGKLLLDWSAVPADRVTRAKLTRIIRLERDAARPASITSLSRRAAVRILWEATGVPLTPRVRENTAQHLAQLAQTIEFAGLTLGTGDLPEPDASLI